MVKMGLTKGKKGIWEKKCSNRKKARSQGSDFGYEEARDG